MNTIKIVLTLSLIFFVSLFMGCSNNNNTNPPVDPPVEMNPLSLLSAMGADEGADDIADSDALGAGIAALFGNPDSEPVEVEAGDTLDDVLTRAGLS